MKKIILASGSPRRKELLDMLSIPYEICESNVDENISEFLEIDNSPYERVKYLSRKKALAVAEKYEKDVVIIGCDTVVSLVGRILNKPKDASDAERMLNMLQNQSHSVYTGLTLVSKDENGEVLEKSYIDCTEVSMLPITPDEIKSYINTGECLDKAGAYAIQGKGSIFIDDISGDYYTVMGLPVRILACALKEFGVNISDYWK